MTDPEQPPQSDGTLGNSEAKPSDDDPGFASVQKYLLFGLSLPERTLRSASGVVGGALRESASLLVPQAFRSSKTYEVFVQQMLDFMAEDVGGVDRADAPGTNPRVEDFVARKAVGNFIEVASMSTVHLSPMLLLAIVSDVAYGSQAYLQELADELQEQGVIDDASTIHHVDDLLESVALASRTTASAFDTPPLSVDGLKETVQQTRDALKDIDPTKVLPQSELQSLWNDMHSLAVREGVNPFAISGAMTLYSLDRVGQLGSGALSTVRAAGTLLDRHVIEHYKEAMQEINNKGIYASLAKSSQPYVEAVWQNFSSDRATVTEDLLTGKLVGRAWGTVRGWFGTSRDTNSDTDTDPKPGSGSNE